MRFFADQLPTCPTPQFFRLLGSVPHLNVVGSLDRQRSVTSPLVFFGRSDVKSSSGGLASAKHINVWLSNYYIIHIYTYRKPPTISPGLIFFRKRFLMGLNKGGLIYGGGGAYTWTIFCVSVIVINKYSNSDKQLLSMVIIVINSGNSDKQ